jgi:hypothetical protein
MRRHLTEREAAKSGAAHRKAFALKQTDADSEWVAGELAAVDAARNSADELADDWKCTKCKKDFPNENNQVSVQVNQVTYPRGESQPLIKDYPLTSRPHLYLCVPCALNMEIITQSEVDTGIRAGRFLK